MTLAEYKAKNLENEHRVLEALANGGLHSRQLRAQLMMKSWEVESALKRLKRKGFVRYAGQEVGWVYIIRGENGTDLFKEVQRVQREKETST